MAQYTDAPDIFHTANAVTLLGACLTRRRYRCQLAGGVPTRWTNLWTFVVGDSAESRKSTTVNMAAEVLSRAMPELRAPDDGSPEGFAKDFVKKENRAKGDAAGMLISSEMGAFLMNMQKDYARPLKGMLMDFYDVPVVYRRTLSKEEFSVERPRFSMLGAVAIELLPTLTSAEDWLGGFMNRALLIEARRTRTLDRAGTPPEQVYRDLSNKLLATLAVWRRTRMREQKKVKEANTDRKVFLFDFEDEALKTMKAYKKKHKKHADPNVTLLLGRGDIHFIKLAAINQVAMDPERPTISEAAVHAAWPLWDYWRKSAPGIMELAFARGNAEMEGDRVARKILRNLAGVGPQGMYETALMRATVLSWEHFNKAMTSLTAARLISRIDDGSGDTRIALTDGGEEAAQSSIEEPMTDS